jgi:cell division protease FtsH
MQRPTEDRYLQSKSELIGKLVILFGGRAAEKIFFDDISTGASNDLSRATELARSMVTQFGMADPPGLATFEKTPSPFLPGSFQTLEKEPPYSDTTAREIDCAVRVLLQSAFERSCQVVEGNRAALEKAAKVLLEKETLSLEELLEITGPVPVSDTAEPNEMLTAA